MLKSTLSVLAGFILWSVLWLVGNQLFLRLFASRFEADMTTRDPLVLVLILLWSVVISVLAGWLCAQVARRSAGRHGLALGLLLLAVGIFFQAQVWNAMPLWYHLIFLGALLPATRFGAGRAEG